MSQKKIIFKNHIKEISRLAIEVELIVELWSLPKSMAFNLNLVLEELMSNIIFYAFEDTNEHDIEIEFNYDKNCITICLFDDGKEFDPLQKSAEEELKKSVEDRKVGGLGIHFVKTLMDEVNYERKNGKNKLTLKKFLN